MNIERIEGNTRTLYTFSVKIDANSGRVVICPSGASIYTHTSARAQWKQVTHITWERRGTWAGYKAYDSVGRSGAPTNHREYDLAIPDDVKAEALASITVVWQDNPSA